MSDALLHALSELGRGGADLDAPSCEADGCKLPADGWFSASQGVPYGPFFCCAGCAPKVRERFKLRSEAESFERHDPERPRIVATLVGVRVAGASASDVDQVAPAPARIGVYFFGGGGRSFELSDAQAWNLALVLKRLTWSDVRGCSVDDGDAREKMEAIEKLRTGLAEVGYGPR
jgi:hypothetical protein